MHSAILVLRTSPAQYFREQIRLLHKSNPDAALELLVQEHCVEEFADSVPFDTIHTCSGGMLDENSVGSELLKKLKDAAYDTIAIPVGTIPYDNLVSFARTLKPKRITIITPYLTSFEIPTRDTLGERAGKILRHLWRSMWIAATKGRRGIEFTQGADSRCDVAIIAPENQPVPPVEEGSIARVIHETARRLGQMSTAVVSPWNSTAMAVVGEQRYGVAIVRENLRERLLPRPGESSERDMFDSGLRRVVAERYAQGVGQVLSRLKPRLVVLHNRPAFVPILKDMYPEGRLVLFLHNDLLASDSVEMSAQLDGVIGISAQLTMKAQDRFGASIPCITVHNGVELDRFNPDLREHASTAELKKSLGLGGGKMLLFASRLHPEKGIHLLLDIMPGLVERHPDATLVIAGSSLIGTRTSGSPYLAYLAERIEKLGDAVRFTGYIPYKRMPHLMSAADLHVLPSLAENEGLPSSLLEAMASGVPTAATRAGGIPEALTDGTDGMYIDPANTTETIETLAKLLDDPEAMEQMGRAARKKAEERFSVEAMGNRFRKLIVSWLDQT